MPCYTYECSCGTKRMKRLSISDRNKPQICSKCGKKMMRIIENGSGVIFKGDGFYEIDYKRKEK